MSAASTVRLVVGAVISIAELVALSARACCTVKVVGSESTKPRDVVAPDASARMEKNWR